MYKNTKEKVLFTAVMCAAMIFFMSCYNLILNLGFTWQIFIEAIKGFPLFFIIGFILDFFIIGKIAGILSQFVTRKRTKPMIKILSMQFFMVTFMCVIMSSLSTFLHTGSLTSLPITIIKNYLVAFLLQVAIIAPVVRFLTQKLFQSSYFTASEGKTD